MRRISVCLQSALVFWLSEGVDGIQLPGVEDLARMVPSLWTDIRAIVQNGTDKYPNKRSEAGWMYGWREGGWMDESSIKIKLYLSSTQYNTKYFIYLKKLPVT